MGVPPNRIDVWFNLSGVEFEECWNRRISGQIGDVEVSFISRQDLIVNKESLGRLQDLADAEKLRATGNE